MDREEQQTNDCIIQPPLTCICQVSLACSFAFRRAEFHKQNSGSAKRFITISTHNYSQSKCSFAESWACQMSSVMGYVGQYHIKLQSMSVHYVSLSEEEHCLREEVAQKKAIDDTQLCNRI